MKNHGTDSFFDVGGEVPEFEVFGPDAKVFRMTDPLLFAFEGEADLLNPLGY